jgi:hypothetical protein
MAATGLYCEHQRTAATCEACAHRDALADPRRAPATRDELYPYPEGGPVMTAFLRDDDAVAEQTVDDKPKRSRRKAP